MAVQPLIPTEPVTAQDQLVGQQLGSPLVPTDANIKTAAISVALIAGIGILLAIRNPRFAFGIMTATLGVSIGAGYVAMTKPASTG